MKRCAWCGRAIVGGRKDKRFCCDACRVAHHRAVHGGVRLTLPEQAPKRQRSSVGEDEIAQAVAQVRGSLAVFDSGARKGPDELRPLCCLLTARIASALQEVGL